jgi:hypothetical protein
LDTKIQVTDMQMSGEKTGDQKMLSSAPEAFKQLTTMAKGDIGFKPKISTNGNVPSRADVILAEIGDKVWENKKKMNDEPFPLL